MKTFFRPSEIQTVGVLLGMVLLATPLRAVITAPDNVVYGTITLGGQPLTSANTTVRVEARRTNGTVVAHYRMGGNPTLTNLYVLRLAFEEFANNIASSEVSVQGAVLNIVVLDASGIRGQQTIALSERGQVHRLDLADNSVMAPFLLWAQSYGIIGDDSDADGDGFSNRSEYLAGTNPTNANDFLRLTIQKSETDVLVQVSARIAVGIGYENKQRRYTLQRSDNVAGPWQPIAGYADVPAAGEALINYQQPATSTPRFFRTEVGLQ